jgi:hypothetical protein
MEKIMTPGKINYSSLLIISFILSGCVALKAYHATEDGVAEVDGQVPMSVKSTDSNTCTDNPDQRTCISFVEFDDFGRLFNRAQLDQTIGSAEKIARRTITVGENTKPAGGVVVVYVHGWKHNAKNGDEDLEHFKNAIVSLGKLDDEVLHYERKIMGIYVGWRGDSVPIPYVKNLTFWDRKITAHSVGDGAVNELFKKLTLIRNKYPSSRLVIVGHSFGTAVVYSAMEHQILSEIIESPPANSTPVPLDKLTKRWDMIVLVNSAFEAMQVRAQYAAARSREYVEGQLPYLVFITSQADWATDYAFPAGRSLSTMFKKYSDTDSIGREMNLTAIGHYIPYVTHQLVALDKCPPDPITQTPDTRNMTSKDNLRNVVKSKDYCFGDLRPMQEVRAKSNAKLSIPNKVTYLSQCDEIVENSILKGKCNEVAPGHYIKRGPLNVPNAKMNPMPYWMPIMNIRTSKEVMNGHNDIWNPVMQNFMVQFMLYTVIKQDEENNPAAKKALTATGTRSMHESISASARNGHATNTRVSEKR